MLIERDYAERNRDNGENGFRVEVWLHRTQGIAAGAVAEEIVSMLTPKRTICEIPQGPT